MKKILLGIMMVFLCTGCEERQSLFCTKQVKEYGVVADEQIDVLFEGSNVLETNLKIISTIDMEQLDQKESYMRKFESLYRDQKEEKGVTLSVTEEGQVVTFTMKIDPKKANEKVTGIPKTADIDEAKKYFGQQQFNCVKESES